MPPIRKQPFVSVGLCLLPVPGSYRRQVMRATSFKGGKFTTMIQDRQFQAAQARRPQDQPREKRMIAATPPEQRMGQVREVVNSSCNAVGGNVGFCNGCRHLPSNRLNYRHDIDCRHVDGVLTVKIQHGQCLNTGRRYGLTEAGFRGILHPSKSYLHEIIILKPTEITGARALGQCGISVRDSGRHFTALEAVFESTHSFFYALSLSARGRL